MTDDAKDVLLADQPKAIGELARHFINAQAVPSEAAREHAEEIIEALNELGYIVISKSYLEDIAAG